MEGHQQSELISSAQLKGEECHRNGVNRVDGINKNCINEISNEGYQDWNSDRSRSIYVIDKDKLKDRIREPDAFQKTNARNPKLSWKNKTIIFCVTMYLIMSSLGFLVAFHVIYVDVINDLDISRAEAALVMSITRGVMFGSGFLSSWVYHMLGPVICVTLAGVLCGIGLISSSFAQHIILVVLLLGIFTGFGGSLMSITGNTVVASSFGRRKALVLSICAVAPGLGSTIFPYLTEYLLQEYGWRNSFLIYGGVMFNTIPAAYFLKLNLSKETRESNREGGSKFDVGVFRITQFRLYMFSVLLSGAFGMTVNLFVVDMVESEGYSRTLGASLLSVIWISAAFGGFIFSTARQLIGIKGVTCLPLISIFMSGSIVTFALFKNYSALLVSGIVCGISYGIQGVTVVLVTYEIAGTKRFSTALGVTNTIYGVGNVLCGPIGGATRDVTGGYDILFFAASIGVVVKGILEVTIVCLERRKRTHYISETK